MEALTEVRTPSSTRQHNRCLGSHRTTKTDGDGAGDNARPAVVRLDAAPTSRHRIQDLRHPVTDVSPHNIRHKEHRQENTHRWEHQIEQVHVFNRKARREQMLDLLNQRLQHEGRQPRAHTHHQADHQHDLSF